MTGEKPDERIRAPMQWSAQANAGFTTGSPWESLNADYPDKNVAAQSKDHTSLLSCYRQLIRLRGDHSALQTGEYLPVDSGNDALLAFLRIGQTDSLLVAANLSKNATSDYDLTLKEGPLAGTYQALLVYGEQAELPELMANDRGGFDSYQPLPAIPAGGVLIIQLQSSR